MASSTFFSIAAARSRNSRSRFYQREELQREVISRIERDPHVVAALIPAFPDYGSVDRVPNAVRAPLGWNYLQANFGPDYQEGNVVFWRRKALTER